MTASPMSGWWSSTTSATSLSGTAGRCASGPRPAARSVGVDDRQDVTDDEPLVRRVDEAAGADDRAGRVLQQAGVERVGGRLHDLVERDASVGAAAPGSTWTWSMLQLLAPDRRRWRRRARCSSRGRIVQYAIIDMSIRDTVSDDMPIFMTRLVAESGWIMNGGAAHVGSDGVTRRRRSCDELAGPEQVRPGLEDQHDLRQLDDRLRAHDVEALDAGERLLERHGDERSTSSADSPRQSSGSRPAAARTPGTRRRACPAPAPRRRSSCPPRRRPR